MAHICFYLRVHAVLSAFTAKGAGVLRYAANIISISRVVLLLGLFFTFHNPVLFFILYFICGFSDVMDGYVARRTKTQSLFGARLDSIADFILFGVICISVILWMREGIAAYLPWIIAVALIRCTNVAIAAFKYHSFAMLHTWGNKAAGFLLFLAPLFILYEVPVVLWITCIVAVLSALEESLIHISSPTLELDRPSIFKR